ncbi:hypothetical protein QJS04_geneDACA011722 [Acorus gramineus]|uniref:ubiquitinyl hydrolase 1 n=1 Tax=Acorus gramineus TaxID=55184 RepID=A0AAV9BDE1_ACOGR|nr:hypothetical protein QJS04_geneDACA011722 [Acorus gramineus]
MTRIFVQRGSGGSSSNSNRSSVPGSSSSAPQVDEVQHDPCASVVDIVEYCGNNDDKTVKSDEPTSEIGHGGLNEPSLNELVDREKDVKDDVLELGAVMEEMGLEVEKGSVVGSSQMVTGSSYPPPPPVPPPKPSSNSWLGPRRAVSGSSNSVRIGSSRRTAAWPVVPARTSPAGSRPSSPRSYGEGEGYNSADEQGPCFGSSYDDAERERLFELDIRRTKGWEVRRMVTDGNCLFRAVADQVYGDPEAYDLARQMCIDYMERERDHFSQFITEGFTSYCKRKRRDKVYGNNMEIQAFAEMYNRPIHIYSYSTEPINIFHGSYNTDIPPIRLSYHHGNHYNSLVDPRRLTVGAGLGFSSLQGINVDKDQIKAAIRAQQDQQIDNALLAEGRFYSDLELTEKEIERMVMEASRAEYLADDKFKQQLSFSESSTSGAEPSSSAATGPSQSDSNMSEAGREKPPSDNNSSSNNVLSHSMQLMLSMGFCYMQVVEAYSIFGDDVDSMLCYLLEMGNGGGSSVSRRKGKATE